MSTPGQTDIECSIARCGQTTPRRESDDYARAKGWHIHTWRDGWGPDAPMKQVALCPGHAGNTKREPKPVNLEGQDPLF
jgi:hypothetical protein